MPSLILNVKAWHGDGELELQLPDTWQLNVLAPDDAEGLAPSAVEAALERPIGSPSLGELARDKASALIVVDDLGRPTRADRVIPTLLAMLTRAGVDPDGISFLVATGSHRPLRKEEIRQKLGSDVATRFPVANHDAFAHDLRHLGTLPSGLPVIVNRRIAEADLVVFNGLQLEGWMERLIEASSYQGPLVVASRGITPLGGDEAHADGHAQEGDAHGAHDAEAHGHEDHGHGHDEPSHDQEHEAEGHEGHDHGEMDPHAWLDVTRAQQYVANIRDGLIEADPDAGAMVAPVD